MGRALFSQKYISAPAVREEQDTAAPALDVPCERWSVWNQFDPDSDEFFKDAQLEHFVDEPPWVSEGDNVDEAQHVVDLEDPSDSSSSTPSAISFSDSDSSLSDSNIPMALGADDPATLLAGAYTPADWQRRFLEAGSEPRLQGRLARDTHRGPRRLGPARQHGDPISQPLNINQASPIAVFVPPAVNRASATAQTQETSQQPVDIPLSSVSRRTVSITPINIPSEPSLPSPLSSSTPTSIIPSVIYLNSTNTLVTPPARNVTPRIYTRSRFPAASGSPTRDSPLTNSRARLSLSRIDTMSLAQHQYNAPVPVLDRRY